MNIIPYDRISAINYASEYATKRNPTYYNFDKIGGNCTNFVSQCIYAGAKIMNFSKNGWYYRSINERAPAWTGVDELYNFLINNTGVGPFGKLVSKTEISLGDVIELGNSLNNFYHSVIVTNIINKRIFVCSNTRDALNVPLDFYSYYSIRYIHIIEVRTP